MNFRPLSHVLYGLVTTVLTLCIIEFGLGWVPDLPIDNARITHVNRTYYMTRERKIVQLLPDCVRYDPKMTYTMLPPGCLFYNREFRTMVTTNERGLRGDEEDLIRPEIVILGDSHAWGWGVDDKSTFASLIKQTLKRKVLNASVPSYGTAREILLLDTLDLTETKWLIIQYCQNDITENLSFDLEKRQLPISSQDDFEKAIQTHAEETSYFPGKYLRHLFPALFKGLTGPAPGPFLPHMSDAPVHAEKFLQILNTSSQLSEQRSSPVHIVVLHLDSFAQQGSEFISEIERLKSDARWNKSIQNILTIDASKILSSPDTFRLDDHMNESGHAKIAAALSSVIASR